MNHIIRYALGRRPVGLRLLAAAAPGDPRDPGTWSRWSLLGPHPLAADAGLKTDTELYRLRQAVDRFCWPSVTPCIQHGPRYAAKSYSFADVRVGCDSQPTHRN